MSPPPNSLYFGKVFHERHTPFSHKFTYSVFTLWCDLDELPNLSKKLTFFSINKWNILSFYNKDHGPRDGSDIGPWIEKAALEKNIELKGGKIFFLGFPRLWGCAFTPLSLYICYHKNGKLKAILYQVKNTFGEQHGYLFEVTSDNLSSECEKIFHVSPFIPMNCQYKFRLNEPSDTFHLAIHQFLPDAKILTATWDGERYDLNDKNILKAILKHPLMTFKVIAGIHWEAFNIWIKGAKYIKKPPLPSKDVS